MNYKIYRYYFKDGKQARLIKVVDTLEEAQTHCSDPLTRKEGTYFDGYRAEYAVFNGRVMSKPYRDGLKK